MRTSARIALNTISRWMGLCISVVVGIIVVPIMLNQFGKEGYGLIAICFALLSLRGLMDFGLRAAVVRQLASAIGAEDKEQYSDLVNSSLAVYLLLGGVTFLVCWTFAPSLASGLKMPSSLMTESLFLLKYYAGPTFFLVFAIAPMASVISANNRFDLLNYIEAGVQLLRAIAIIVVLTLTPWGMYGWVCAEVGAVIVNLIAVTLLSRRVGYPYKINLLNAKLSVMPLKTSAYTFILSVSEQISTTSDNFVLSAFLGPGAVGLYQPGRLLSRRLRPVIDAIKNQLHPLATTRFTEGRMAQVESILIEGTKYRLLMGIGACVGLGVYAPDLVHAWLGDSLNSTDLQTVSKVMAIWAVTDLITYAGGSQWPVLFGMKEFPFLVRTGFPLALCNLAASIYLVGFTEIGLYGVVIPTFFMEAIRVFVTFRHCCNCLKISFMHYFRTAYFKPLIVFVVLTVFSYGIKRIFNPSEISALVACAITCATAWGILVWIMGFDYEERKKIQELFKSLYKKAF